MKITTAILKDLEGGRSDDLEKASELQGWGNFFATFSRQLEDHCRYSKQAKQKFFAEVFNRLPKDKADRYVEYFKNDLPSLLFDVEREYGRIHNAQDRHISYQYDDEEKTKELAKWLEMQGLAEFLKKQGTRAIIRSINDYYVCLPYPNNFVRVNVKSVLYVDSDSIVFMRGGSYFVVDSEEYRIFRKDGRGYVLDSQVPHELGYAPFTSFWHSPYFSDSLIQESPVYSVIDKAFRFLDHQNGKDYYDAYAKYEIIKLRSERCDYEDPNYGGSCSGGYVSGRVKYYDDGTSETLNDIECPRCKSKRMIGAGTIIEVPTPADPSINNWEAIERIGADVPTLQYNTDETDRLTIDLMANLVGFIEGVISSEAINREQVSTLLEKKKSILIYLAGNFEKTHQFIIDTCAKLLYSDGYLGSIVKYGSEFFLRSSEALTREYKETRESSSDYQLSELQKQIDRKSAENNPQQRYRLKILRALEPFLQRSISELSTLYKDGLISDFLLMKKINFSSYIERFERENGDIAKFAILEEDFNRRISSIEDIINSYVLSDLNNNNDVEDSPADS